MARGAAAEEGAERTNQNGYTYVKVGKRWVSKHKLIAEQKLGREITDLERVIFLDGNRANFDPANIQVVRKKGGVTYEVQRLKNHITRQYRELHGYNSTAAEELLRELLSQSLTEV
jgi:hypothetical protein